MASVTKAELVSGVATAASVSKAEAEKVLTAFFDSVRTNAKKGNKVAWPGFGSFTVIQRAARQGRNPRTGVAVKIKASKAVKFTPSLALKDAVNNRRPAAAKAPAKKATAQEDNGQEGRRRRRRRRGRLPPRRRPSGSATLERRPGFDRVEPSVPTSTSIENLLVDLAAEHAALDDIVGSLDDRAWDVPTPSAGWAVRDQIGHLTFFDGAATRAVLDPAAFAAERDAAIAGLDDYVGPGRSQGARAGPGVCCWPSGVPVAASC